MRIGWIEIEQVGEKESRQFESGQRERNKDKKETPSKKYRLGRTEENRSNVKVAHSFFGGKPRRSADVGDDSVGGGGWSAGPFRRTVGTVQYLTYVGTRYGI
jgi:hypothetical protein